MTEIVGIDVYWADRYGNLPEPIILVDQHPKHEVFTKRPLEGPDWRGRQRVGWHIYWSEIDGLVWFFTWGGKPDDGFGGARREVKLDDGTTELVIGGWHASSDVPPMAGFPAVISVVIKTDPNSGGIAGFMLLDRFEEALAEFRPDLEMALDGMFPSVKWRGQISKDEYLRIDRERTDALREQYKAKYSDGSWHHGMWSAKLTEAEHESLHALPYSALGPVAIAPAKNLGPQEDR